MNLIPVTDARFKKYGRIVKDVDFKELIEEMEKTPCREDVIYVASVPELEALPVFDELVERTYGEMPVQIGYCNGKNKLLNALEYHRSSEIDVAVSDLVLMLGKRADITEDFQYDSANVEAFLVPAGTAVEVFADTLQHRGERFSHGRCSSEGNQPGSHEEARERHRRGEAAFRHKQMGYCPSGCKDRRRFQRHHRRKSETRLIYIHKEDFNNEQHSQSKSWYRGSEP